MSTKSLLIALLCLPLTTYPFIFNLFRDVAVLTQALDQVNAYNRQAVTNGVKRLLGTTVNTSDDYSDPLADQYNQSDLLENITRYTDPTAVPLEQDKRYTFKDLAGKIPVDVLEIVDFLKNPEEFNAIGAQMPKGILLVGPPGTGKTSIARALAGEAEAAFFTATASEFIELYVGTGPQRVRKLFESAHKVLRQGIYKKAIIFIDEIDAIGGSRSDEINSEYRNTLNELLNQMDGFKQDTHIFVLAATNNPNQLDAALKRPGRFDRIVTIGLPDFESRRAIIKHYCTKIKADKALDFDHIAKRTPNWSGAELKNLVNEAAIRAVRNHDRKVNQKHFDQALELLIKR